MLHTDRENANTRRMLIHRHPTNYGIHPSNQIQKSSDDENHRVACRPKGRGYRVANAIEVIISDSRDCFAVGVAQSQVREKK